MNRYPQPAFYPLFGIAAVAMTLLTFVFAVGVPTSLAPTGSYATTFSASTRVTSPAIEVDIIPARIDVVGVRDTNVAERQNKPRG